MHETEDPPAPPQPGAGPAEAEAKAGSCRAVPLLFRIAPGRSMIEATGALLRARVEITAQSQEEGRIFGKAAADQIDRLRRLPQFAAVERDCTAEDAEGPYTAAIVTLWGWSSSIRIGAPRQGRERPIR